MLNQIQDARINGIKFLGQFTGNLLIDRRLCPEIAKFLQDRQAISFDFPNNVPQTLGVRVYHETS